MICMLWCGGVYECVSWHRCGDVYVSGVWSGVWVLRCIVRVWSSCVGVCVGV